MWSLIVLIINFILALVSGLLYRKDFIELSVFIGILIILILIFIIVTWVEDKINPVDDNDNSNLPIEEKIVKRLRSPGTEIPIWAPAVLFKDYFELFNLKHSNNKKFLYEEMELPLNQSVLIDMIKLLSDEEKRQLYKIMKSKDVRNMRSFLQNIFNQDQINQIIRKNIEKIDDISKK